MNQKRVEKERNRALDKQEVQVCENSKEIGDFQFEIREILESIRDGFFSLNQDWRFIYVNRRAAEIMGLTPEQIIGRNIWESYPQLLGTEIEKAYRKVLQERTPIHFEHIGIGSGQWFEIRVYPAGNGGISVYWIDRTKRKKAEKALQQAHDDLERQVRERTRDLQLFNDKLQQEIQEHKLTEKALKKSREDYKHIIQFAPSAIYEIDFGAARFTSVNEIMCTVTGYSEAEFLSMNPISILDEESKRKFQERTEKILSGEKVDQSVEYKVIAKDGREIILVLYMKMIYRDEKSVRALVIGYDITERKRTEQQIFQLNHDLKKRIDELQTLLEVIPMSVCIAEDPECKTMVANRAFEELLGIPSGINISLSAPPEEKPSFKAYFKGRELLPEELPIQRAAATGKPVYDAEYDIFRADGKVINFYGHASPLFNEQGEVRGAIGAFDDITERKQIEEALREADKQKDDFLAILSHELRNPLGAIRNSLTILDRSEPEGAQAKRAKDVINRQMEQLSHLVDDLLDITRITRNKIELKREIHDLNELVRRTVDDHRPLFDKNGVSLKMELTSVALIVDGDVTRLVQVIGNLLLNAAKFTKRGDSTRITVERDPSLQQAMIRVIDTGIGIEPVMIPRLFQPFMQADTSLDRSHSGLGLGLALSKGLVALHGGDISVKSAGLGKGSEFIIRLPLDGTNVELQSTSPQKIPHRNKRVLIIDDNLDLAGSLCDLLELCEHEVALAYDGYEGLKKAREFKPEVLLCDIGLPGMDGYEVAKAFRADKVLKDVFLVALTGYAQSTDQLRAHEAGFERHLAKPVDLNALETLLAEIPLNISK